MAKDDPHAATVTDPDGHEVVLLARISRRRSLATIPNSSINSMP
jgi:hypothetical protein